VLKTLNVGVGAKVTLCYMEDVGCHVKYKLRIKSSYLDLFVVPLGKFETYFFLLQSYFFETSMILYF
jgi:hypothetical protein